MKFMERIKGIEKIKTVLPGWSANDIAFIKQFSWESGDLHLTCFSQARQPDGWPDMEELFYEIGIIFEKVSDLQLRISGGHLFQVSGLVIEDIQSSGLEGINFRVEDYENGDLSFWCEAVTINTLAAPMRIYLV